MSHCALVSTGNEFCSPCGKRMSAGEHYTWVDTGGYNPPPYNCCGDCIGGKDDGR